MVRSTVTVSPLTPVRVAVTCSVPNSSTVQISASDSTPPGPVQPSNATALPNPCGTVKSDAPSHGITVASVSAPTEVVGGDVDIDLDIETDETIESVEQHGEKVIIIRKKSEDEI